jgi:DNA polymerase III subunit delta
MPAPKKSATSNFTAVLGTDESRVKETALGLSRELAPADAGDFGVEIIDGVAESADHCERIVRSVMDALQTLPFFGGGKLVWLKNANFLADTQVGKTIAALDGAEAILDYVEKQLPPEVKFLLSATAVDKRRSAFKRMQKLADLRVFDRPDTSKTGWEDEVMPLVARRARELGLTFDEDALEMFVQLAGEDTRQLDSELEKIALYLGGNARATLEDVRAIVPLSRAGIIFEVGNAIGKRDLRRALELLRTLVYQGQNPVGILLGAIVPRVRSLLLAADIVARHPKLPRGSYQGFVGALDRLPPEETAHLPKKKDGSGINGYPIFLALDEARRFTIAELRAALRACLEANLKLVTTALDAQLVLERLLIGMLGGRGKQNRAA